MDYARLERETRPSPEPATEPEPETTEPESEVWIDPPREPLWLGYSDPLPKYVNFHRRPERTRQMISERPAGSTWRFARQGSG